MLASGAGTAVAMGAALVVGAAGEAIAEARRRRRWRLSRHPLLPMSPLSAETWSRRLSYEAYFATVSRNRATFDEVYRHPAFLPGDVAWLRSLPPLRVLAIGEDWCPDVFQTLPTWARLVEELPGWELGVFARDAHPDLMEAFLWEGDRQRIPVYAFYLGDRLQVWWSGRGAAAEQALAALLAGRRAAEISDEERCCIGRQLQEGYGREFRRQNLDEVLALLRAFFHVLA